MSFDFVARQERFINRWIKALSEPRVTHEHRSIWISYWTQVSYHYSPGLLPFMVPKFVYTDGP